MKPIKLFGESKTGTTYLEHLILENVEADVLESSPWGQLGWKHGFPRAGQATYVFIFRDVYEWAKSLIAGSKDKRYNGLDTVFGDALEEDHWHQWEHPLRCRTVKYYSYLGFQYVHSSILVRLGYLQQNPASIVHKIGQKGYHISEDFTDIDTHTYLDAEGKQNPQRKELTPEQKAFIEREQDYWLENFVTNLTIR